MKYSFTKVSSSYICIWNDKNIFKLFGYILFSYNYIGIDNMIEVEECKNMNDIRYAIDELDSNIIKLMSQRLKYVRKASNFKKDETDVRDSNRVKEVIESKKKLAIEHDLPPELIGNIYKMMIDSFIEEELEEWHNQN